jgi:hypothetical protein
MLKFISSEEASRFERKIRDGFEDSATGSVETLLFAHITPFTVSGVVKVKVKRPLNPT